MRRTAKQLNMNFGAGLNTEASPLDFPLNATVAESNFVLLQNGTRRRRNGMQEEASAVRYNPADIDLVTGNKAVTTFDWHNAEGIGEWDLVACQVGYYLIFYRKQDPWSANRLSTPIDLRTLGINGATEAQISENKIQMASGRGKLYVVGEYLDPFYITFDNTGPTFTATKITLKERDFSDVTSSIGNKNKPAALTDEHEYYLRNNGWSTDLLTAVFARGTYPALNEIPYQGYRADVTGLDVFDTDQLAAQVFGDGRAPRGHFIINVFDTTEARGGDGGSIEDLENTNLTYPGSGTTWTVTTAEAHGFTGGETVQLLDVEVTGFPTSGSGEPIDYPFNADYTVGATTSNTYEITAYDASAYNVFTWEAGITADPADRYTNPNGYTVAKRPKAVAFYAGRVWYAGVKDDNIGTKLFFSQVVESDVNIGRCYQQADPTSEHLNRIVSTDGGVLNLSDIGVVYALQPMWDSLLVFADNGVWQVTGSESRLFNPTSFNVEKISAIQVTSPGSLVEVEDTLMAWAKEGIFIFQLVASGFNTRVDISSITEDTIQTLYQEIPDECKERADAVYDDVEKRVIWCYSTDTNNVSLMNKQLWLDMRLPAFSTHDFPVDEEAVIGVLRTETHVQDQEVVKYLLAGSSTLWREVYFGELANTSFLDFPNGASGGVDAAGYVETSYDVHGDSTLRKQTPLVWTYMSRTAGDSSCFMSILWDWAVDDSAGNQSAQQQIYKSTITRNTNNSVVQARNKVRGSGHSLRLRFDTEAGKDCVLVGWAINSGRLTDN